MPERKSDMNQTKSILIIVSLLFFSQAFAQSSSIAEALAQTNGISQAHEGRGVHLALFTGELIGSAKAFSEGDLRKEVVMLERDFFFLIEKDLQEAQKAQQSVSPAIVVVVAVDHQQGQFRLNYKKALQKLRDGNADLKNVELVIVDNSEERLSEPTNTELARAIRYIESIGRATYSINSMEINLGTPAFQLRVHQIASYLELGKRLKLRLRQSEGTKTMGRVLVGHTVLDRAIGVENLKMPVEVVEAGKTMALGEFLESKSPFDVKEGGTALTIREHAATFLGEGPGSVESFNEIWTERIDRLIRAEAAARARVVLQKSAQLQSKEGIILALSNPLVGHFPIPVDLREGVAEFILKAPKTKAERIAYVEAAPEELLRSRLTEVDGIIYSDVNVHTLLVAIYTFGADPRVEAAGIKEILDTRGKLDGTILDRDLAEAAKRGEFGEGLVEQERVLLEQVFNGDVAIDSEVRIERKSLITPEMRIALYREVPSSVANKMKILGHREEVRAAAESVRTGRRRGRMKSGRR